jgi:hypothetical protein
VEIVDQELLSESPQKDARIIGGKREEESSRGSTMEVYFMLKNPKTFGEEDPFYIPKKTSRFRRNWNSRLNSWWDRKSDRKFSV